MTLATLYSTINGNANFTGKVCYNAFPVGEAPSMPFICIIETNSDNFGADNIVYHKRKLVDVELYTEKKDTATEEVLEGIFDSAGIFYESSDIYIEDERCYERIYSIEV